jgi:hypothetical protein
MTPFFLLAGSGLVAAVQSMTMKLSGHGGNAKPLKGATSSGRTDAHAPLRRPKLDEPFTPSNPSSSLMDKRHD